MAFDQNISINNMKEIISNLFLLDFLVNPEKALLSLT